MEIIFFYINSARSLKNASLSLANIGPELNRDSSIVFVCSDEYYLEVRNSYENYLEGAVFDSVLVTSCGKKSFSKTAREVLKNLFQNVIVVNQNHILRFGALRELRRAFGLGHFGFVGNTLKNGYSVEDLYDESLNCIKKEAGELSRWEQIDSLDEMSFITTGQNFCYFCDDEADFGIQLRKLGFRNFIDKNIPIMEGK